MYKFLSFELSEKTPMYGGKKGLRRKSLSSIVKEDSANTTFWQFPNHLGTHVDFPSHFFQSGQTVNDYTADFWVYTKEEIQYIECTMPDKKLLIKPDYLSHHKSDKNAKIILLKTGSGKFRSKKQCWEFNPGISIELVIWIREKFPKLKMIGIDSISISSWQHRIIGRDVHKMLLNPKQPILPIEDMDLTSVNLSTDFLKLIIAPFRVTEENGSPCTVIAEVN